MSQAEILDIVALVQNNPVTKLSGNYGSKIIQKIKENFDEEGQQLFVANFYCYLNYNSKTDFVINLDKIWKWLGYGRIDDCKRPLCKHFVENVDYKIDSFAPETSGAKTKPLKDHEKLENSEKDPRGGHNKEYITMTINCFKKLCLVSRTKEAYKIHDYYVQLEELMNDLVTEQTTELQLKLKSKDKEQEHNLLLNFSNKQVVYFILVESDIIKFGFTKDIKTRMYDHRTEFGKDIVLALVFETIYNREFETVIKQDSIIKSYIIEKKYKKNQTELIQLSDRFTYKNLCDRIDYLKNEVNENLVPRLMQEIVELRARINELATPDKIEVIELKEKNACLMSKIAELELQLNKKSDISLELEMTQLRAKNAELVLQLRNENLEFEKLEVRKKELDLKYNNQVKHKNPSYEHIVVDGVEQKFCVGIICREETGESGRWLDLSCFGKDSNRNDGLKIHCKKCRTTSEKFYYTKQDQKMSEQEINESKAQRSLKLRIKLTDGKKSCTQCKELLDLSSFKKNGKYVTGEDKYYSKCVDCTNTSRRESNKIKNIKNDT
jgi:predicted GIY-YIG superfamily endonuclease